jgi:hypothetical protein
VTAEPADARPATASPQPASPALAVTPDPNQCALLESDSARATPGECLACHRRLAHGGHAYDGRYPRAGRGRGPGALRPLADVAVRGLVLRDEQMSCTTCHDGASPWKYRIRLPRGAAVTPAVNPRRPGTYERPESLPPPRHGDDVARKPLCLACHALD